MKSLPDRLHPLLLLGLCGALYFTHLAGTDLKEPNEPISAQAAREMVERGDWLFPTVNGEPYPDKPPLLFWAIALASAPFGEVNEIGARLPSAVAATLLVLLVYFLARSILGSRGALFASATLAVSTFFVEQARYVQHDMLLCLGVTVSVLALFRLKDGEEPRLGWTLLAASGVAIGVLDKGPIGLALPAMILAAAGIFEASLFQRLPRLITAGLLGLAPVVLYYLALARRGGWEIVETFLFRHNMDRFVAGFDHEQPWWYFLARAPVDLLPGTLLLPAAAFLQSDDPARRRFHRRCWIWILLPLVFFSLSASKRPVYLLPILPPIALLCGALLEALSRGASRTTRRLAFGGIGCALGVLALAGLAAPVLAWRRAPFLVAPGGIVAVVAVAGAAVGIGRLRRGSFSGAAASLLTCLFALWLVAIVGLLPAANGINSPRPFAEEILRQVPAGSPLMTYGLYRFRCGYIFYTGRAMPRLADVHAVGEFLNRPERVFCVLPLEDYEKLEEAIKTPAHVLARGGAGRRREVLISNRPSAESEPSGPGPPGTGLRSPPPDAHTENGS